MRITPKLRPRSAISRTTSLIGLQPSRGAYLFSSSSTTKVRGWRVPCSSLACNNCLRTTPTTKRFGEEKAQQPALAELTQRANVRRYAFVAGAEFVDELEAAAGHGRPEGDIVEGPRRKLQVLVLLGLLG